MPPRWRESPKRDPCTLPLADSTRAAGPELASATARASAWARPAFPPGERPAPGPGVGVRLPPLAGARGLCRARCAGVDGPAAPIRPPSSPGLHRTAIVCAPVRPGWGRRGLVPRAAHSPLQPASGRSAPTYLAGGTERGPGLAAGGGGGGGASRPSDHLW